MTLASQWKSQFDDSEETTDNEWKQEPQASHLHETKRKTTQTTNYAFLLSLKQSPDHRDKSHGHNQTIPGSKSSKKREFKRKR